MLGRRLRVLYPVVPLAQRQALGIAVMSYDGHLGFGLLGDFDALPELEAIASDLKWAIARAGPRCRGGRTGETREREESACEEDGQGARGPQEQDRRSRIDPRLRSATNT